MLQKFRHFRDCPNREEGSLRGLMLKLYGELLGVGVIFETVHFSAYLA